ncbi:MAG: hypothetical protein AAGF60_05885, partial [Pseudomonadota bacterium]
GKKAPLWLAARPKVAAKIKPIPVKSKLEVDPRKWKKKVIEDGVRGVARYELALFSTILGEQAKKLTKEIPEKDHKALKPGDKGLQKPQITALDEAAAKAEAAWKKIAVKIADKVSIALEEIASDKGDNTKALAAGKSAIRKFDQLDTSKMFTDPTKGTVVALVALGDALKKNAEDPKAWAAAHTALTKVDSDFEKTGKTARNVVKYLKDQGPKIAKDKGAAPELRKVGDLINSNAVKPHLTSLDQAVMRFENALEAEIAFLKAEKGNGDQVKNRARAFGNDNKDKDKDLKAAVAAVKKVSKAFSDASKAVK